MRDREYRKAKKFGKENSNFNNVKEKNLSNELSAIQNSVFDTKEHHQTFNKSEKPKSAKYVKPKLSQFSTPQPQKPFDFDKAARPSLTSKSSIEITNKSKRCPDDSNDAGDSDDDSEENVFHRIKNKAKRSLDYADDILSSSDASSQDNLNEVSPSSSRRHVGLNNSVSNNDRGDANSIELIRQVIFDKLNKIINLFLQKKAF